MQQTPETLNATNHEPMVRNFKTDYLNDVVIFLQFFGSGKINDFKILDFLEKLNKCPPLHTNNMNFLFQKIYILFDN